MRSQVNKLRTVFELLNTRMNEVAIERRTEGLSPLSRAAVTLLGQMSLLAQEEVSAILTLAQTGDMDALLEMDFVVKVELKKILEDQGFLYDEDSPLIWIPPGATFKKLFEFDWVEVRVIDAESALVSKAIKAPNKNKVLIREAIASENFPKLVDRILSGGGLLEDFL